MVRIQRGHFYFSLQSINVRNSNRNSWGMPSLDATSMTGWQWHKSNAHKQLPRVIRLMPACFSLYSLFVSSFLRACGHVCACSCGNWLTFVGLPLLQVIGQIHRKKKKTQETNARQLFPGTEYKLTTVFLALEKNLTLKKKIPTYVLISKEPIDRRTQGCSVRGGVINPFLTRNGRMSSRALPGLWTTHEIKCVPRGGHWGQSPLHISA